MASQIFKFPGFFDREIDLTARVQRPIGVPMGIVGAAERGPAFVPITVGSFSDFRTKFGGLNPDFTAPYAVQKILENRSALTFLRVLGAGTNQTSTHFDDTRTKGIVANAGFKVSGAVDTFSDSKANGAVQFLVARHVVTSEEAFAMPMFTNNDTFFSSGSTEEVYLVRAVIMAASGARVQVLNWDEAYTPSGDDIATVHSSSGLFKLVISSSAGATFAADEGQAGVRVLSASFDPTSADYFGKVLNSDPEKFSDLKHLIYCDFAVDAEVATVGTGSGNVLLASGTLNTSTLSGDTDMTFQEAFGRFDTRFKTPRTPWFISQPYGSAEYDLFYVESIDDGEWANQQIKISIASVAKSTNPRDKHGTFSLVVRTFGDTDLDSEILEQFNNLSLDPNSDSYIGKIIGTKKVAYSFDVEDEDDRRLVTTGKFPNKSRYIRVVLHDDVEQQNIPEDAVPFGFRGVDLLNTNSLLRDVTGSVASEFANIQRLFGRGVTDARLLGAIVPPIPFTFKVTRGDVSTAGGLIGAPGAQEIADARLYWGVKFTRNSDDLNPNIVNLPNPCVASFTKFVGLQQLDVLLTGSARDSFCENKFTLARVALSNGSIADVTSSTDKHMKEAAYIRNGHPDVFEYKITDGSTDRITLATLFHKGTTAADFNKFSNYAKFTTFMFGGFQGLNILDKHAATMNDRSTSTESRDDVIGNAAGTFTSPGFGVNQNGVGLANSTVNSYRIAADIITDSISSNVNIVSVPGQREPLVTDYFSDKTRDFGLALHVMDVPNYNSDGDRIFDGETTEYIDVDKVADAVESRALDNTYISSYFPDVLVTDSDNERRITVPASVAALAAIGYNDRVSYPWFAPAGFNRASLDFVHGTRTRIKQAERERLFDVNVNPIVKLPSEKVYVIAAQNTMEQAGSALSRINVVRMLNELKRQVILIGNRVLFEQIDQALRNSIKDSFSNVLKTITARAGIESFDVIADARNNTAADEEDNRINVKIILVPTRSIDFIAVDFIITRNGVSFY